jgi:hypothetical protein
MPTVERDISIGEAGDVSIGDLHEKAAESVLWKKKDRADASEGRPVQLGSW